MSKDNTYNLLLSKLLNGSITSEEKWELEKASLDDPFLADAIEGYYDNGGSTAHLEEIKQSLYPTEKKSKTRSLLIRRLSIAASLLALFTASFWMFKNTSSPNLTAEKSVKTEIPAANKSTIESGQTASKQKAVVQLPEKNISGNNTVDKKSRTTSPDTKPPTKALPKSKKAIPAPLPQTKDVATQKVEEIIIQEEKANASKNSEVMDEVVITEYDEDLLSDNVRRGNYYQEKVVEPTPSAKKEKSETIPIKEEQLTDLVEESLEEEIVIVEEKAGPANVSQGMAIPPSVPTIRRGIVRDDEGVPLKGVTILDSKSNPIATTNEQGLFSLPEDMGYVITSFTGYDSKTVAVTDQLTIELQPTAKALSERHLRLIDQMNDSEVQRFYTNKLNELFSRNWPICRSSFGGTDIITNAGRTERSFTRTHISVSIKINDAGRIEDLTYFEELEPDCSATINDIFNEAMASGVFETGRGIEFRYRINL